MAALRVRRALNRLAWSSTKCNAVVLFDRRVSSKEYGATILHTLAQCSQQGGRSYRICRRLLLGLAYCNWLLRFRFPFSKAYHHLSVILSEAKDDTEWTVRLFITALIQILFGP